MTIVVYCSNGHRGGKMAFRFYQRRLYSALPYPWSDFNLCDKAAYRQRKSWISLTKCRM